MTDNERAEAELVTLRAEVELLKAALADVAPNFAEQAATITRLRAVLTDLGIELVDE